MGDVFSLKENPFPLLVKEVNESRFTGIIFVNSNKWKKGIILKDARLCSIQSNRPDELLGSILKDMGIITEGQNSTSLSRARIEGKKQGEVLVGMGAAKDSDLEAALKRQLETRFLDIFTWSTGIVQKVAKGKIEKDPVITRDEFNALVMKGIMEKAPFSVIIDSLSRYVDSRPRILGENIPYDTGIDLEELERHSVSEILLLGQDLPRALLGLFCTGLVSMEESKHKKLIEKLRFRLRKLRDMEPYERFGLDPDATEKDLDKAYIRVVKANHPDIYSSTGDPEVMHLANEIFTTIQSTYSSLKKSMQGKPVGPKEINPELRAELLFSDATEAIKAKDYEKAIDLLRVCVKLNPDERVFMESLAKAMFLKWQSTGRDNSLEIKRLIRDGIKKFPKSDTIYVILGWVLKNEKSPRAADAFRRALKINPDNLDAQREMRLYYMRSK